MIIGFGNNVVSSLAADITATQTTIQVMPGAGALFAGLLSYDYANDSNPLKTYAKITLTDAKETVFEVCHLTAVNNDMLTVVRGQEGSDRKGWSLNDVIANFATRGSENQFVQIEQLQSGHYTSAVAGGTENGLTLALPATYFLNGSTDWALKTPILIYPTLSNTGASTLQLTMGGRVMGTYPLVKGSNTALRAGDIVAKNPFLVVLNVDQGRFVVLNPSTDVGSVRTVNTHSPDTAGNVKLGTAADADIGTAAGNVLGIGTYGIEGSKRTAYQFDDFNNFKTFGFYNVSSSKNPPPGMEPSGLWFLNVLSYSTTTVVQTAYGFGQAINQTPGLDMNRVFRRTYSDSNRSWTPWVEFYSEAHKPTAVDMNALPLTGGTMTGEIKSTSANAVRMIQGGYGAILRMDANGLYFLQTNKNDPNGNYNANRSLTIQHDTGAVTIGTALSVDSLDFIHKTGINAYSNGGHNFNQTNGMRLQGLGDQVAEMYLLEQVGDRTVLGFHIAGGGNEQWIELHATGEFTVNGSDIAPVGIPQAWPQENPPLGWLICNGAGFNTSLFPLLLKAYPNGVLPDLRGVFLRGKDNGRGIDPNRVLGDLQWGQAPASAIGGRGWGDYAGRNTGHTSESGSDNDYNYAVQQETEQQRETRPVNISVNYIVRAA